MARVAILRCGKLPSFVNWEIPNLEELFEEDKLLIDGFEAQGIQAEPLVWNRPDLDWNQFDLALIRSTWDYLDEQDQFLQVLAEIESSSCKLFNPLAAIQWNIDKHYLFDLEKWGLHIIPTIRASDLETHSQLSLFGASQIQTLVLKPTVGLGGSHSYRVPVEKLFDTLAQLRAEQPNREYLLQPFIDSIIDEGEWSFIYFDRKLSHVLLKQPAPNDYRVQGIYGGTVQLAEPSSEEIRQADHVIAHLPFDVLYARLDFVRVEGHLAIIEIELIEPIFSFNLVPASIARLVDATRARLEIHS
jgi:glutathione synthase/RimK-type ligase-like ATP-grasp enzyme